MELIVYALKKSEYFIHFNFLKSLYDRRQKMLEEENVRTARENEELRNELMKLEAELFVDLSAFKECCYLMAKA